MQRFYAASKKPIPLGYAGENLAREIAFDIGELRSIYGEGNAHLMVRRTGEDVRYPVFLTIDGDFAIWKVTEADSAIPGCDGSCELSYTTEDGVLAKSETWATFVLASMTCDTCDPPEVAESWLDALRKSAAETQLNADSAATSATSAEESAVTAGEFAALAEEWAKKAADGGTSGGGIGTDGKDGKDGVGIQSIERTDGDGSAGTTDTYTITLTDGTSYTFTVYNGADGEDGKDGADGRDGVTPKLKIENDYWYVSYDNGATWEKLGKATGDDGIDGENGEDGDSIFKSVTQDDEYVYFNLSDGTMITLPKHDKENIQFEDLQVKAICCKNWDTNNDGELSYAEAAAVETIGQVFSGNTNIIAFTELKYFTGLTEIEPEAFYGAYNLNKITLPKSIKSIGDNHLILSLQSNRRHIRGISI